MFVLNARRFLNWGFQAFTELLLLQPSTNQLSQSLACVGFEFQKISELRLSGFHWTATFTTFYQSIKSKSCLCWFWVPEDFWIEVFRLSLNCYFYNLPPTNQLSQSLAFVGLGINHPFIFCVKQQTYPVKSIAKDNKLILPLQTWSLAITDVDQRTASNHARPSHLHYCMSYTQIQGLGYKHKLLRYLPS